MLAVIAVGSMVGSACNTTPPEKEENKGSTATVLADKDAIVTKGKSDYKIVVDEAYSVTIGTAISEFNTFLYEATKCELEVVTDANATYSETAKYISFGENAVQESAKVEFSADTDKKDSFMIDTVGNSVFVLGASDTGTLYGAYELLHYLVGFEFYGVEMYEMQTNVASVPLMDFNVLEIPSFAARRTGFRFIRENTTVLNRLRYESEVGSLTIGNLTGHTSLGFLPVAQYLNEEIPEDYHPEWYDNAIDPMQLCYTAHGDEASLQKMLEAAFATLKSAMIRQPEAEWCNFSMTDSTAWCGCPACKAEEQKYNGSMVAAHIKFLNRLAEMSYEWFETEEGKPHARDLKFEFYAYMQLEAPPVAEKNGEFVAVDESVICHEKVYPTLAMTKANYTLSLKNDQKNAQIYRNMRAWEALTKDSGTLCYFYCSNYSEFLVPYDTFGAMYELYNESARLGSYRMYNLGHQGGERGFTTGFNNLKIYLDSKLAWNVKQDYGQLIDNFFNDVYKEASPHMRAIFDGFRALSEYNTQAYPDYYLSASIYPGPSYVRAEIWPRTLLETWRGKISEAVQAIEYLKELDLERYEITYKYITVERIWIDYLLYQLYINEYSATEQKKLKMELYNDLELADTREINERSSIAPFKQELLS